MSNESAPPGKGLKYARIERERRFLLAAPPATGGARAVRITDRYLVGTRLRLRRAVEGEQVVYKFTQKIPDPAGPLGLITTMYLTAEEYEVLVALPALELTKVRYSLPPLVVDAFEGGLSGLCLAEAEFDSEIESAAYTPPKFVVSEVTGDPRFRGGDLVETSREGLGAMLSEYGLNVGSSQGVRVGHSDM